MVFITTTRQISWDCVQVTLSMGSSFFIRTCYLQVLVDHEIVVNRHLSDVELEDLIAAGLVFAAEKAAMGYLERAEHSRHLLTVKLKKKGYADVSIQRALDYLEERSYLSDLRYAESWLRNRAINHAEGRSKLLSGLLSKGIGGKIANAALDNYFHTIDEDAVLNMAIEKCLRLGKSREAMERYLARKGFSYKQIKSKISNL